jgi:hypothetical protein
MQFVLVCSQKVERLIKQNGLPRNAYGNDNKNNRLKTSSSGLNPGIHFAFNVNKKDTLFFIAKCR